MKWNERDGLLEKGWSGKILKIVPLLNDENNKWIYAGEFRAGQYQVQEYLYANYMANALPFYLNTLQS